MRYLEGVMLVLVLAGCGGGGGSEDPPPTPEPTRVVADSFALPAGQPQLVQAAPGVLTNDSVAAGASVTVELVTDVSYGQLLLNADGGFSYSTHASFSDGDRFSYRLLVNGVASSPAEVTLSGDISNRPSEPPEPINSRAWPVVGVHPSDLAYWEGPALANAMATAGWLEFEQYQWGIAVEIWDNPQFDANGYPRYLNPGRFLRAIVNGLHMEDPRLNRGHVVLTWQGTGDLRLSSNSDEYLAAESSGALTGSLADGRRVYRFGEQGGLGTLEVLAIDPADPITDIKIWLSDPADPLNRSLEGQLWHPRLLERIADFPNSVIRTMAMTMTNGNPERDWSDRRRPDHFSQAGQLNPRSPAPGALLWDNSPMPGNRATGIAWEYLVALANTTDQDLWINLPHMASDDYIDKLGRLFRYGSDGVEPYASTQANPRFAPLKPGLRVWVEYSNEIWAGGPSFPQGDYARIEGEALGISQAQFNARQFCNHWARLTRVMGDPSRVVKVMPTFTGSEWYDDQLQAEVASYCPTVQPAIAKPDLLAVTTYFGNDIQGWAYQHAQDQAGSDDPWFFTGDSFDAGGGAQRPVSLPITDPYWQSAATERHEAEALAEWKQRMLSGDAAEGSGPDATGLGGGFESWVRHNSEQHFGTAIPIVAYEGGPSVYTDNLDGGDERDDGITNFMMAINERPEIAEIYRIHLNMAVAKGLVTHNAFTLVGAWGKYGQWGHLRSLAADPADEVKYQAMLDWQQEEAQFNPALQPQGAVPAFVTPAELPFVLLNQPVDELVTASGGDGALSYSIIGQSLVAGLQAQVVAGGVRLTGSPTASGTSYLYLRVNDSNGDRDWRIYVLRTIARSSDPAVTIDFDSLTQPSFGVPAAEPIVVADSDASRHYQFTSQAGLMLEHQFPELGWYLPWPSMVLHNRYWGGVHKLERDDGRPFDLWSLDLAIEQGGSAEIRAEGADGYIWRQVINLPPGKTMTTAQLDLIEIYRLEIRWFELADGEGRALAGAIDNLRFNQQP
ncbi:MAG: hypothetical protein II007_12145 [Gammaproteobacteria bacterium]|nr:hypothetical protein [Gammaproteobacteria bacterium]